MLKFSYHWTTTKDEDFTLLFWFFMALFYSPPPSLSLCVQMHVLLCAEARRKLWILHSWSCSIHGMLELFHGNSNPNSGLYECTVSPLSPGATSLALAKFSAFCTCSLTFPPCYVTKQRPHEMRCQPSQLPELSTSCQPSQLPEL